VFAVKPVYKAVPVVWYFLVLFILASCANQPQKTLENQPQETLATTSISNTIDAEGKIYFTNTQPNTYTTLEYNGSELYDDGQLYRVQIENVRTQSNTSELGKVSATSDVARKGSRSLKFQTNATSSQNYSKRAELRFLFPNNKYIPHKTDVYAGFSIRFPGGFQDPTSWLIFHQIWQQIHPPVALELAPSSSPSSKDPLKLQVVVRNNNNNSIVNAPNELRWPVNKSWADGSRSQIILSRDRWYDFVLHWRTDPYSSASGVLEVWLDGKRIVNYRGKIGYSGTIGNKTITYNATMEKTGLYRGPQTLNQYLYQDEIRTGNSYSAVAPGQ
jgi:Polysaccharide lyase